MKLLAILSLLPAFAIAAPASVSGGKTGAQLSSASTTTMQTTQTGHGGGTGRLQDYDPRQVPPLDPKREVTEQDCTKPVDLTKGNLKCK
jgi:hypothetical protein